jgi:hypothetical protein
MCPIDIFPTKVKRSATKFFHQFAHLSALKLSRFVETGVNKSLLVKEAALVLARIICVLLLHAKKEPERGELLVGFR